MAYFINPIEGEQCLCVSCEGEIPLEDLAGVGWEAHGLLNIKRWFRMLIDITQLRSSHKASQLIDFSKALAGKFPRNARVALVVRSDQTMQANLFEKISRKHGMFLAYFLDPGKAALWIQRSSTPSRRKLDP